MPAFYILVILGLGLLWLLLSDFYEPLGRFVYQIWKDAKNSMKRR
jgi:hypothetical protein